LVFIGTEEKVFGELEREPSHFLIRKGTVLLEKAGKRTIPAVPVR